MVVHLVVVIPAMLMAFVYSMLFSHARYPSGVASAGFASAVILAYLSLFGLKIYVFASESLALFLDERYDQQPAVRPGRAHCLVGKPGVRPRGLQPHIVIVRSASRTSTMRCAHCWPRLSYIDSMRMCSGVKMEARRVGPKDAQVVDPSALRAAFLGRDLPPRLEGVTIAQRSGHSRRRDRPTPPGPDH